MRQISHKVVDCHKNELLVTRVTAVIYFINIISDNVHIKTRNALVRCHSALQVKPVRAV